MLFIKTYRVRYFHPFLILFFLQHLSQAGLILRISGKMRLIIAYLIYILFQDSICLLYALNFKNFKIIFVYDFIFHYHTTNL